MGRGLQHHDIGVAGGVGSGMVDRHHDYHPITALLS